MQLSVMGCVTTIFEWVVQCINGGLLNVLFKVEFNQTAKENMYKLELNQDKLLQYLKAMILMNGKELPLEVLESFPEDIGGGERGVQIAREHPNREAVFLIGPLIAAILMLIAVLGLVLFICCACGGNCCCGKPKRRRHKESEDSEEEGEVTKAEGSGHQTQAPFDNGNNGFASNSYEDETSDSESDDDSTSDKTTTGAEYVPQVSNSVFNSNPYFILPECTDSFT